MYGYWWGYTSAQLELMAIDQPMISYSHSKDKKKGFKKASELKLAKAEANYYAEDSQTRMDRKLSSLQTKFNKLQNNKE